MRLRYLALIALGVVFVWMLFKAPVPGMKMQPVKPDARLPTFERSLADKSELGRALGEGRLIEDPKQHRLRVAVLDAGDRLAGSPCDEAARASLRSAATAFIAYQRQIDDDPPAEALVVDGHTIDARGFFNAKAADVYRDAVAAGVVSGGPPVMGASRRPGVDSRFSCGPS